MSRLGTFASRTLTHLRARPYLALAAALSLAALTVDIWVTAADVNNGAGSAMGNFLSYTLGTVLAHTITIGLTAFIVRPQELSHDRVLQLLLPIFAAATTAIALVMMLDWRGYFASATSYRGGWCTPVYPECHYLVSDAWHATTAVVIDAVSIIVFLGIALDLAITMWRGRRHPHMVASRRDTLDKLLALEGTSWTAPAPVSES